MVLGVLLVLLPGCSIFQAPQKVVSAVVPGVGTSPQADPAALQIQVQRFADDFCGRTIQALDEYAQKTGTEAAQIQALRMKLSYSSAVIGIASGPNPNINLLDMVTVTTLMRMSIEDYWIKTSGGAAYEEWLLNSRVLETNAWTLATAVLKREQIHELRHAITQWYERNPQLRSGFLARPQESATQLREMNTGTRGVGNVFSLVGLDPTAGLDPAVREVTRTRLFAERTLFVAQHMPFLLRWQTELLTYELTGQRAVREALTNTARLSDSAERISHTVAELPDRISTERKAILDALQEQEGKLRQLSAEVDRTLVSGTKMSESLNTTLITFDALMKRFGVGEPDTNSVPDTNSPPFNILDYGKVADQTIRLLEEHKEVLRLRRMVEDLWNTPAG